MKNKEMIEEMAKDFKSYLPSAWYNDKCVNGEVYSMVKHAYEDNYRKLPKETLEKKLAKGSKETAEKFYDKINENICVFKLENKSKEYKDGYIQAIADICGRIDQVAKQFGVEIKE